MKTHITLALLGVLISVGPDATAQSPIPPQRIEIPAAVSLTTDDMLARQGIDGIVRDRPPKVINQQMRDEHARYAVPPLNPQIDPSELQESSGPASPQAFSYVPRMLRNFAGPGPNGSSPADPMIAAGPDHVVMVVNTLMQINDKQGNLQIQMPLGSLFSPNAGYPFPHFDPKVIYDKNSSRFMLIDLSMNCVSGISQFNLAVSKSSNPVGGWWIYTVNNYIDNNWIDYPGLGVGENALYIGGNYLDGFGADSLGLCPATVQHQNSQWIIDKAPLLNGSAASAWRFTNLNVISPSENTGYIQPVVTWNAPFPYDGFLTAVGGVVASVAKGYVWGVTLPSGFPASPPVLDRRTVTFPERGGAPFSAPQLGGPARLMPWNFGAPPQNAMCYGNRLATVTHRAVGSGGNLQYILYDVSSFPTLTLLREGLYGAGSGFSYFYPATALNFTGDLVFSFARSNSSEYAGARWALWMRDEPAASGSQFTKAGVDYYGEASDADTTLYRWGDYGGAATDPSDEGLWVYHKYADTRAPGRKWGTWVGYIVRPVFVDKANVPIGVGSRSNPFRLFGQGVLSAKANNDLVVKAGSYNEAVTISLPINIIPDGGTVTIGQ